MSSEAADDAPRRKRGAEIQLTQDNADDDRGDDDFVEGEGIPLAAPEVIAQRKIIKVKRSGGGPAPPQASSENPFASSAASTAAPGTSAASESSGAVPAKIFGSKIFGSGLGSASTDGKVSVNGGENTEPSHAKTDGDKAAEKPATNPFASAFSDLPRPAFGFSGGLGANFAESSAGFVFGQKIAPAKDSFNAADPADSTASDAVVTADAHELPAAVVPISGEEDEDSVYSTRVKLFVLKTAGSSDNTAPSDEKVEREGYPSDEVKKLDDKNKADGAKEWKERGRGMIKINIKEEGLEGKAEKKRLARLLLRQEKTNTLLLNASIFTDMGCQRKEDRRLIITCVNMVEDATEANDKKGDSKSNDPAQLKPTINTYLVQVLGERAIKNAAELEQNVDKYKKWIANQD